MNAGAPLSNELTDTHKNRLALHQAAHQKIAHAKLHDHIVGLLLIDLDNFQSINNQLGHHIGDKLLLKAQSRLAACLGADDFIARIDGDEFAVILGNIADIQAAGNTVHKLMACFKAIYNLDGINAHISASMGIAYYPDGGNDSHSLLQSASISMCHAKSLGGNNYQYHTNKLDKLYKKRFYLENALRFALEKNELYLNYQPIFNLVTKKMVGIEALLRWHHPVSGLIAPDVFITLAEKNGLISSIGEWGLRTVCEQAKKWHHDGYDKFKISFNISSHQLLQKSFPQLIMRIFKNAHIPAQLLDLELTETAFLTNSNYFKTVLKKISAAGISITIDDFGIGHSSLIRLKHLPIRALKIDKSFIQDITPDSFDAIIVKTLIDLGKKLNMNVIAEGIETEEHLQFLTQNGCPQGQGYYLCKPLNAVQMTAFLENNKLQDI